MNHDKMNIEVLPRTEALKRMKSLDTGGKKNAAGTKIFQIGQAD